MLVTWSPLSVLEAVSPRDSQLDPKQPYTLNPKLFKTVNHLYKSF